MSRLCFCWVLARQSTRNASVTKGVGCSPPTKSARRPGAQPVAKLVLTPATWKELQSPQVGSVSCHHPHSHASCKSRPLSLSWGFHDLFLGFSSFARGEFGETTQSYQRLIRDVLACGCVHRVLRYGRKHLCAASYLKVLLGIYGGLIAKA